jgi:serine/threonine-protein kinase
MAIRIVIKPATRVRMRKIGILALWLFGGGALIGAAFIFSFYMAMKIEMRSTEVAVPDLTSLSMEEASTITDPMDLRLEVADHRHDLTVASGKILQQDPVAGASVRRGRRVKLVMSLGGKVLEVPDLTGKAARAVVFELRRDGYTPGDEARAHSREAPAGRVVAQAPLSESPAVPGTRVHRLVSEGPREPVYVMPDLIGLSGTAAQRWIRSYGFRVGPVREIGARKVRQGQVVGQSPPAGYPVPSTQVVELSVAR